MATTAAPRKAGAPKRKAANRSARKTVKGRAGSSAGSRKRKSSKHRFKSAAEMREVLDRLLTTIDGDAEVGPRLRSTRVPHRLLFPDMDLACNVTGAEDGEHYIRWSFSEDVDWTPVLTLEMSSEVANRYLQGRENLAIGIARREIRCSGPVRAALAFLPASRSLIGCYRGIVKRDYPHLLLS